MKEVCRSVRGHAVRGMKFRRGVETVQPGTLCLAALIHHLKYHSPSTVIIEQTLCLRPEMKPLDTNAMLDCLPLLHINVLERPRSCRRYPAKLMHQLQNAQELPPLRTLSRSFSSSSSKKARTSPSSFSLAIPLSPHQHKPRPNFSPCRIVLANIQQGEN